MKLFIFFFLFISATNVYSYEYKAKVIKVIDGDTIVVNHGYSRIKIRLLYIDAPELDQEHGVDSKKFLYSLLNNKIVTINTEKKDRYQRQLSEIYIYENQIPVFINAKMIKSGNAWVYKNYRNNNYLINLENYAKTNKLGLWSGNLSIKPWEFRKNK
ncbi:MAG: nuclease [Gammaproteobacteria bacterium]|nr:nuclease [Gammaproteobacteria bacterium]|tara:strand:- start:2966 stop:3436 length:471 start_codon:yes stop_codon:yes gene_type:complete